MDNTGQQLHPNWRALATVHIPIKRFIKEGTHQLNHEKYKIKGIKGDEIKEFYKELVNKPETQTNEKKIKSAKKNTEIIEFKQTKKDEFEVRNYFRYAMENKVDNLKMMDFQGQNINVLDIYGWSSLMMAACEGSYETVEFLLTLGVNRDIRDKTGKSAKDLALKKGYFKVVDLLEKTYMDEYNQEDSLDNEELQEKPFYCETCKIYFKETSEKQHQTSTVHQFNLKSTLPANKLQKFNIPSRNKGLQLMVKQGWDKESGLGPSQAGRLYPVKTVIRKQRTGLGIEQEAARVTHFEAFDRKAVLRDNSDYYRKKPRNRNDMRREKVREWKRDRRLRNELN